MSASPSDGRRQVLTVARAVDEFLDRHDGAKPIFLAVRRAVGQLGRSNVRVSKSQIAFRRRKNFALVWSPRQYLRGKNAPLVLTVLLTTRIDSPRWKEVVEPAPGHFTHHLELHSPDDVDGEVLTWLRLAWEAGG